jgi:secondary thiamine-phosphate synthase enzyme
MEFTIKTSRREEIVDITEKVRETVSKILEKDEKMICNKKARACLIFVPHTTCAIIINEISDERVGKDLLNFLGTLAPKGGWLHDSDDGNGDAHVKSILLGESKIIPIEQGKLCLGTWQAVGLAEFDGPRERRVIVQVI